MEVDGNEEAILDDSENIDDNDDESETQQGIIEEEAIEQDKTENNLGLLSNSIALCKDDLLKRGN